MLVGFLLQLGESIVERAEGITGPFGWRVAIGQLMETDERGSGLIVLRLQLVEGRFERGRFSLGVVSGFQMADGGENLRFFFCRVGGHGGVERNENLANFSQSRLMVAMNGGDLAGHEIQAGQFFPQVVVMDLLDVITQGSEGHGVGVRRGSFGNAVEGGQHGDDCGGIETFGLADFRQRFLATTTVVDAEAFENACATGIGPDNVSDGGLDAE